MILRWNDAARGTGLVSRLWSVLRGLSEVVWPVHWLEVCLMTVWYLVRTRLLPEVKQRRTWFIETLAVRVIVRQAIFLTFCLPTIVYRLMTTLV